MIGNNQLTTLILLAIVGFMIYHLTQPDNIENEGELEPELTNDTITNNNLSQVELEETVPSMDVVFNNDVPNIVNNEPTENENDNDLPIETTLQDFNGLTGGASNLDDAFGQMIPETESLDKVDFNRNNVTQYNASDYLPKEVNDEWFDTDFTQAKYTSNDDKMINTDRYVIGVNTVGQSLKNPSYDIRGTIPNPKFTVSPWLNSTYEPDNNIKSLY